MFEEFIRRINKIYQTRRQMNADRRSQFQCANIFATEIRSEQRNTTANDQRDLTSCAQYYLRLRICRTSDGVKRQVILPDVGSQ
jgi:hypothetical protein